MSHPQPEYREHRDDPRRPEKPPASTSEEGTKTERSRVGQIALRWFGVIAQAAQFYRQNLRLLGRVFADHMPKGFVDEDIRRRHLRFVPGREYKKARRTKVGWEVQLPFCCVVCGGDVNDDPVEESRQAPDITWPLLAPLAGGFVGVVPGMFLLGWWTPFLTTAVGCLIGYGLRRQCPVALSVKRCKLHRRRASVPALYVFRRRLHLFVGHKNVRLHFLRSNRPPRETDRQVGRSGHTVPVRLALWILYPVRAYGASVAGAAWVVFGGFQLVAAIIESIGAGLLVLFILRVAAETAERDPKGTLLGVVLIIGLAAAYVSFRLKLGYGFLREGLKTLKREAGDTLGNAFASIGFGFVFGLPVWFVLNGTWRTIYGTDLSLTSFPGVWIPIGLGVNALLLMVAGLLALFGRSTYLTGDRPDRPVLFVTGCPACGHRFAVRDQGKIDSLDTCPACEEVIRVKREE